jgi:hypothetical protein
MFAKLIFPTGTLYTQICRDITRAIVNSTGAGGSTVGALEFADQTESTIDDTVASGWALAPGFTVASGANVDADMRHVVQSAHANTSTISVAIRTQFVNTTANANNTTNSAVVINPVSEFGESYELDIGAPDPSTNASSTFNANGVTGREVYIIAREGVLMIAGERGNAYPGYQVNFICEADGQECREGRNRPGVFFMQANRSVSTNYSSTSVATKAGFINYTTNSAFAGFYQRPAVANWVDCMYDYRSGREWRAVQYFPTIYSQSFSSPSTATPTSIANWCSVYFDENAADGCGEYDHSTNGEIAEAMLSAGSSNWSQGYDASTWYPRQIMNLATGNAVAPKDLAGSPAVKFTPGVSMQGFSATLYNYADKGGYYMCTGNFPGLQTTLTTSEGDFLCIKLFATSQSDPFGVAFRIA